MSHVETLPEVVQHYTIYYSGVSALLLWIMSHFLSSTKEDKKQQNSVLYAIFGGEYLYGVEITDRITAYAGGGIHVQTGSFWNHNTQ